MASRRDQIKLTPDEQLELLDEERVVIATTIGPRGWPHSMPLWFTVRDGDIWAWTFANTPGPAPLTALRGVELGNCLLEQEIAVSEQVRRPR